MYVVRFYRSGQLIGSSESSLPHDATQARARKVRGVPEKARYSLQVSFHVDHGRLSCAAALREIPLKRIMKTFRLQLDIHDDASFTSEASRVANGVVDALKQALKEASSGLGISEDEAIEERFQSASKLLSADNPKWLAKGDPSCKRWSRPALIHSIESKTWNGTSEGGTAPKPRAGAADLWASADEKFKRKLHLSCLARSRRLSLRPDWAYGGGHD